MKTIPTKTILSSKGLGDTIGDIVSSFNLDLNSNYGAIRGTRMKSIPYTNGTLSLPTSIVRYQDFYYLLCNDYVYKGGLRPSENFDLNYTETDISSTQSDMKLFNGSLYVSTNNEIHKNTSDVWTQPITSGLASSVHLFEVFTSKLYVTDSGYKVFSISTSDVLTDTGVGSINLGLDSTWAITTLKAIGNQIFIGLLNSQTGKGRVYTWDGNALIPDAKYELESGVVAGTVLDNKLWIIDSQGILKSFAGNAFVEEARLPKKNPNFFNNTLSLSNLRYVHPNGMKVTDKGTILILLSNEIENIGYDDTIPSGIWEYDKNIGLYHKYSVSVSPTGGITYNDFGQQRLSQVGALYLDKPAVPSTTENGNIICGATYFTNSSTTAVGIFCDDTFDTTTKYANFITSKIFSNLSEQWKKVYTIYKKFANSSSEIIIKYRTEEDEPTETTVTWTDIDRFTSSVDISAYTIGDEIQILQGVGSGFTAHISSIDDSTYIIDEQLPSACIGLTGKINVNKWKKVGTGKVTYNDREQFKALTLYTQNTSPFIQFKVCMKFNTKDELNKLQIISEQQVKE